MAVYIRLTGRPDPRVRRISEPSNGTGSMCTVIYKGHPWSAGKVRFGSDSEPLVLNAEPEWGVWFGQLPYLESEPAFRNRQDSSMSKRENSFGVQIHRAMPEAIADGLWTGLSAGDTNHLKSLIYTKDHSQLQVRFRFGPNLATTTPMQTIGEHRQAVGHKNLARWLREGVLHLNPYCNPSRNYAP
ncbi:hypothetical protein B0H14DRAFT_2621898 [Mycena olivaceomarginata]|nr:hypothetical protein B0H14DRAFT_2621898 [Mycena olivaceomarginata]